MELKCCGYIVELLWGGKAWWEFNHKIYTSQKIADEAIVNFKKVYPETWAFRTKPVYMFKEVLDDDSKEEKREQQKKNKFMRFVKRLYKIG